MAQSRPKSPQEIYEELLRKNPKQLSPQQIAFMREHERQLLLFKKQTDRIHLIWEAEIHERLYGDGDVQEEEIAGAPSHSQAAQSQISAGQKSTVPDEDDDIHSFLPNNPPKTFNLPQDVYFAGSREKFIRKSPMDSESKRKIAIQIARITAQPINMQLSQLKTTLSVLLDQQNSKEEIISSLKEMQKAITNFFKNKKIPPDFETLNKLVDTYLNELEPKDKAKIVPKDEPKTQDNHFIFTRRSPQKSLREFRTRLSDYIDDRWHKASDGKYRKGDGIPKDFYNHYDHVITKLFGGLFGGFSAGIKISAASKLDFLLNPDISSADKQRVKFDSEEIDAIFENGSRLGEIVRDNKEFLEGSNQLIMLAKRLEAIEKEEKAKLITNKFSRGITK